MVLLVLCLVFLMGFRTALSCRVFECLAGIGKAIEL